jgi:hypothetical protein
MCQCNSPYNSGYLLHYTNAVFTLNAAAAFSGLYKIELYNSQFGSPLFFQNLQPQALGQQLVFNMPYLPPNQSYIIKLYEPNGTQLQFTTPAGLADCLLIQSVLDSAYPKLVNLPFGINGYAPAPTVFGLCEEVEVCSLADLPSPDNTGLISLEVGKTYTVKGEVDISPYRLFATQAGGIGTMIRGTSSETSILKSTLQNGQALVSGDGTTPLQNLSLQAIPANIGDVVKCFDFECLPNYPEAALDWYGVNVLDSNIGTFRNFGNLVFINCAMIGGTQGMVIGGTVDSIVFFSTIFRNATAGGTLIQLEPNTVVTRRFRFAFAPILVPVGSTGIDIPLTVTMNPDSYEIVYASFSGGGNYIAGIQAQDNRADFNQNKGIDNTGYTAAVEMAANATATVVGGGNQGVFLKVLGNTVLTSGKFTQVANNQFRYDGAIQQKFLVTAFATFSAQSNNVIAFKIAKNNAVTGIQGAATANAGNRAENVPCQAVVTLAQNDVISLFGVNTTNTGNFTVTDLSLSIILA